MDETTIVRNAARILDRRTGVAFLYWLPGNMLTTVRPNSDGRAISTFESVQSAAQVAHEWNRSAREIELFQRRLTKLDPAYAGLFDGFRAPPNGVGLADAMRNHRDALELFAAVLNTHPGTMADKFVAMGSPPAIAHACGITPNELGPVEHVMELQWEYDGKRPEPRNDGRVKPVREPATNRQWASIADLAQELGCAAGTLYNHLRGNPAQPAVRGRVFEYAETGPVPGSIAAMTEDERNAAREATRALGFEPRF